MKKHRICALALAVLMMASAPLRAAAAETDYAAETDVAAVEAMSEELSTVVAETASEEMVSSSEDDLSENAALTTQEAAEQTEEEAQSGGASAGQTDEEVSLEEETIGETEEAVSSGGETAEEADEEDGAETAENLTEEDQDTTQEESGEDELSSQEEDAEDTLLEEEISVIEAASLEEELAAASGTEDETQEEVTRYFLFDIDKSGSMRGTRLEETKESVYKLCEDILSMDGNNYISISCNGGGIDYTDDLEALLSTSIYGYMGSEHLYDTLEGSYNALSNIDDGEKYLIVFDGIDSGYGGTYSGPYTKYRDQHQISYSSVATYNALYNLAEEIKESGISLYIVSSAVNSQGNVSRSNGLLSPHKVADDMANEGCYYYIEDGSSLSISFEEDPSDPIDVTYETTEIESDEFAAVYEIRATVTNTLQDTTLSDVFVSLGVCQSFAESAIAVKGTYYPSTILTDYGEQDQEIEALGPLESVEITWRISFDLTLSDVYEEDLTYYFTIAALCDQTSVTVVAGEVNPDRVCLNCEIASEEVSYTNLTSIYQITATLTNKSDVDTLTNVYAALDLDEGASLWDEYGEQIQTLNDELAPGESWEVTWYVTIDNTEYADGGSFYYYIEVGSDETDILLEEGVIELDAINGESNVLDLTADVWSFLNFGDNDEGGHAALTESYISALLDGLDTSTQEALKKSIAEGSGGHCYGMSATVILNKMNAEDITAYTGTDTLYEAELDENETMAILCYYHLTKETGAIESAIDDFLNDPVEDQLETLWEEASAVSEGGTPVLVMYDWEEYNGEEGGAHVVVAFDVEEGTFTSSATGTERTYNRRILVYDCNSYSSDVGYLLEEYGFDEERCILFNEGTDEWEIPAYAGKGIFSESSGGVGRLCLVTSDLSLINSQDFTTHAYNTMSIRNKITFKLLSGSSSWTIYGNTGTIEGDSVLTRYYDSDADIEGSGILNIFLPEEMEEYSLVTESGEAQEILIDVLFDDRYLWIEADAAEGIEFSEDGSITLLGNEGEFEILIADDNVADGEFDVYTVTGDTEGDIVITLTDDSILVEGDSIEGITIEASEEDVTDTLTVDADVESVEFGRNEEDNLYCKSHTAGDAVEDNRTEATCTEEGSYDEVVYCVICGQEISRETITLEKTGHTEGDAVIENSTDPDCTTAGSYDTVIYCSVCGEEVSRETTEIEALGHTAGEAVIENSIEATCTEDGSYEVAVYCSVCGEEISREKVVVEAVGHTAGEAVIENRTEPTCTEDGSYEVVVYCEVCSEQVSRETIGITATGHTEDTPVIENETDPTCEEEGSYDVVVYCSVCGEEIRRETIVLEAVGHKAEESVIENEIAATCTEEGSYDLVTYCSVCGEEISRETIVFEANGHEEAEPVIENVVDATCTEDGSYDTVIYCMECGEEISREITIVEAYGHTESAGVIENYVEATCTEEGSYDIVIYCSVCGEEISRETTIIEAYGHTESTAVIENSIEPDCTSGGSYEVVIYCSTCGEEISRTKVDVEALGHKASLAVVENYHAPTCTSAGSYQLVTYCEICHETLNTEFVSVAALGHSYVNNVCTRCGAVLSASSSDSADSSSSSDSTDSSDSSDSASGSVDAGTEGTDSADSSDAGAQDTESTDSGVELFSITEPIPEDLGRLLDMTDAASNACGAVLTDPVEELKSALLTEEERELLHDGAVIRLYLVVNDCTEAPESISEEDRSLIESVRGANVLALYLDIALYKQVGDGELLAVTQTNAPISVELTIPDSLKATGGTARTWQIVRVHDGQAELLSGIYDEEAGTFTFETDRFSAYALVYADTEESAADGVRGVFGATGDSSGLLVWILLACGCAGGLMILAARRRRQSRS